MRDDFLPNVWTLQFGRFHTYWEVAEVSWDTVKDTFTVRMMHEPIADEDGNELAELPEWRNYGEDDYLYWVALTIFDYSSDMADFPRGGQPTAGQIIGTAIHAHKAKMIQTELLKTAMLNNWRGYIDFPEAKIPEEA